MLMTCPFTQVVNYGVGGMNGLHEDSVVTEKGVVAMQPYVIIVFVLHLFLFILFSPFNIYRYRYIDIYACTSSSLLTDNFPAFLFALFVCLFVVVVLLFCCCFVVFLTGGSGLIQRLIFVLQSRK